MYTLGIKSPPNVSFLAVSLKIVIVYTWIIISHTEYFLLHFETEQYTLIHYFISFCLQLKVCDPAVCFPGKDECIWDRQNPVLSTGNCKRVLEQCNWTQCPKEALSSSFSTVRTTEMVDIHLCRHFIKYKLKHFMLLNGYLS